MLNKINKYFTKVKFNLHDIIAVSLLATSFSTGIITVGLIGLGFAAISWTSKNA